MRSHVRALREHLIREGDQRTQGRSPRSAARGLRQCRLSRKGRGMCAHTARNRVKGRGGGEEELSLLRRTASHGAVLSRRCYRTGEAPSQRRSSPGVFLRQ